MSPVTEFFLWLLFIACGIMAGTLLAEAVERRKIRRYLEYDREKRERDRLARKPADDEKERIRLGLIDPNTTLPVPLPPNHPSRLFDEK